MNTSRSRLRLALSLLAATALSSGALAGAFGIREQSAIGLGLGFAGAASGAAGLSSMYWNPATITMSPGWTSEYNISFIAPSATITPVPGSPTAAFGPSGEIGESALVPASYSSYQINENLWVGLSGSAPFGLITKPNTFWSGQVYSRSSKVYSINLNPIIGIKINDWLSIAGGPAIEYFKTRLTSAAGPRPSAGSLILEGSDWGVGYTAGVTITPLRGTQIGVGFRSSIDHNVEGTLRTPLFVVPTRVSLNLPEMLTVGLTQTITDQLKLDLGFEFTNWSRLKTPGGVSEITGLPLTSVPLKYNDGYMYSVGLEYQWDPRWAFRVGVAYEESPIDINNRSTRLPDTDRLHAGLGATYRWNEKLAFSASYSHLFRVGSRNNIAVVPGNPSYVGLPFIATTDTSADIVALAVNYRWDDTGVAIPAPIVRKY